MDLAVKDRLIWPAGSWFERTEIRTRTQGYTLQQLAVRKAMPDEAHDDPTVPAQTVIHYSTIQFIFLLGMGLMLLGFGTQQALLGNRENWWVPVLMLTLGAWLVIDAMRKLLHRGPQITIGREGITLAGKQPHLWENLDHLEVLTTGSGKSARTVLRFRVATSGVEEIGIDDLKTSKAALRHALKTHRHRWQSGQLAGTEDVPQSR